jgi:hypothetical protein
MSLVDFAAFDIPVVTSKSGSSGCVDCVGNRVRVATTRQASSITDRADDYAARQIIRGKALGPGGED